MKKYLIIDADNEKYYYNDEIEQGFALDSILDKYERYEIPYTTKRENCGIVDMIIIKLKEMN